MALHMVQEQTPWWASLAEKVVVPMVSNALERQRQRDENRKQNAFYDAVNNALYPNTGGMDSGQLSGGFSSGGLPEPEGYNSNAWAQAFHRNNSPLQGFDTATAGLTPFTALSGMGTQPAQQKNPTMLDIQREISRQRGSKRFGSLSPEVIENIQKNMIATAEAQRIQDMKKRYVDEYGDADDWDKRMDVLTRAGIDDAVDKSVLATVGNYAQYRQPNYKSGELDTGDEKLVYVVNPATGEVTTKLKQDVGISPNTKYTVDNNAALEGRRLDITETANDREYSIANRNMTEAETQGQYERDNPKLEFITDSEGNRVGINPRTGKVVQVQTPDGQKIKVPSKDDVIEYVDENGQVILWNRRTNQPYKPTDPDGGGLYPTPRITQGTSSSYRDMTTSQQAEYKANNDTLKDLRKERARWAQQQATFADTPNDPMYIQAQKELDRIDNEIGSLQQRQEELVGNTDYWRMHGDNSPVAWLNPKGKAYTVNINGSNVAVTEKLWEELQRQADEGAFAHIGIKTRAELEQWLTKKGYKRVANKMAAQRETISKTISGDIGAQIGAVPNTSGDRGVSPDIPPSNSSSDVRLMPPLSSDLTSSPDVPPSVSTDITNHTTSEDQQEQLAGLNGDKVESSDIRDLKPTSQDRTMATPAPRKAGDEIDVDIPDALYYNAEQDKDTPKNKIFSREQFQRTFSQMLSEPRYQNLTPDQIIQKLINEGYRIKDNSRASLGVLNNDTAPEITGTTFAGMALPGLASLGASSMGQGERYASGIPDVPVGMRNARPTLREDSNYLPPVPSTLTQIPQDAEAYGGYDSNGRYVDYGDAGYIEDTPNIMSQPIPRDFGNYLPPFNQAGGTQPINPNVAPPVMRPYTNTSEATTTQPIDWSDYEMPEYDLSEAELTAGRRGGVRRGAKLIRKPTARKVRRPVRRRTTRRVSTRQTDQQRQAPRRGLTNYEQQRTHVDGAARRHGVEPALIRAMIEVESGWDPRATSNKGAKGLMQLIPGTARENGVRNPYDPAQNIEGGTKYIAKMLRRFKGDLNKALMAYNGGAGNISKGYYPAESRKYLQKVMAAYRRIKAKGY